MHPQEHQDEEEAGSDEPDGPQWKLAHFFTASARDRKKRITKMGIIVKIPKAAR